jgi:hypothetical protein
MGEATSLSSRVFELLSRTIFKVAGTRSEHEEIYRLRYQAYRREGSIYANNEQLLSDGFDEIANSISVGVYIDHRLAGAIRLHVVDNEKCVSPACEVFQDILGPVIRGGATLIDPNRFVTDGSTSRQHPELPYVVLCVPFAAARYYDVDYATATVRPEHSPFYAKVLGYQTRSEPRHYPTLLTPLSLMTVDFRSNEHQVTERYPFFAKADTAVVTALRKAHPNVAEKFSVFAT